MKKDENGQVEKIKKNEKIFCKICNTQTNFTSEFFGRSHSKKCHNISLKEYYDKYIKKENEGICLHCGGNSKFIGYHKGYRKFCSVSCSNQSEYMSNKISESFKRRNIDMETEKRRNTCLERYGVNTVSKLEKFKEKTKNTCLEKYGHVSNLLTQECHDKRWKSLNDNKDEINQKRRDSWTESKINTAIILRRNTCLERYGVDTVSKLEKFKDQIRKTNEDNGMWTSRELYGEYYSYHSKVRSLSRLHYDKLFEMWDGRDYYTNEILIINDKLLQPSVDHKTSVYYGFCNNISCEDISLFDNLCICSISVNSRKNKKCEKEFKEILNNERSNRL